MKVFVSQSFQEEDKKISGQIKNFVASKISDIQLMEKEPSYAEIWEDIKKRIDQCQATLGIITKGDKVENKDEWKARGWVLTECAYSFGRQTPPMPVPLFVEKGVSDLGLFRKSRAYFPFSRDEKGNLKMDKKGADKYLRSIFVPTGENYSFKSVEWNTQILKDGHGITEYLFDIYIPPVSNFEKVFHTFGFGPIVAKTEKFPAFQEMKDNDPSERFSKHTVFGRIVDNTKSKLELQEKISDSSDSKKSLYVIFHPKLEHGSRTKYSWGWSCPRIFIEKKISNRLKYDDEAMHIVSHPTEKLCLSISFDKNFPLAGDPWLVITDRNDAPLHGETNGNEENCKLFSKKIASSTTYNYEFNNVQRNSTYKIRWKLKN